MSTESHPSPTGSSSSSQYGEKNNLRFTSPWERDISSSSTLRSGGGGNSAGANEHLTQPSPAKPTWAQILNSNPNNSSTTHPQTSSPSSQQHSATTGNAAAAAASKKNISPSTGNLRPANVNPHDQQQQQQQQHSAASQMNNWSLNFTPSSSTWMMDDETQRNSNVSQQSTDNDHNANAGNPAEGTGRSSFASFLSPSSTLARLTFRLFRLRST